MSGLEVLGLNDNELLNGTVNKHIIRNYLDLLDVSDTTRKDYERYIVNFFSYIYGNVQVVEDISKEMIEGILPDHADKYKNYLYAKKESRNTVSKKIKVVKYMYNNFLGKYSTNILGGYKWLIINPFANIKVKFREGDVKSYDSFSDEEIEKLLEIADPEDALLYEHSIRTGVRESALINLNLTDIKKINGVWCITGKDKNGTKFCESITNEMYEKAKELAKKNNGKIFKMTRQTALRRLKGDVNNRNNHYLAKIGLTNEEIEERGLCFHSFKKNTVVLTGKETNGNMTEMQKKGHHKDPKITMNIYNKCKEDKSQDVGLKFKLTKEEKQNYDNEKHEDMLELSSYSKEDLIAAIEILGLKNDILSVLN